MVTDSIPGSRKLEKSTLINQIFAFKTSFEDGFLEIK